MTRVCYFIALANVFVAAALLVGCRGGAGPPPASVTPPAQTSTATGTAAAAVATPAAPPPLVAIDAGHGGPHNIGASHTDAQGHVDLVEKDLNLDIARRIDRLLRAAGYRTAMIRDSDYGLSPFDSPDFTANVRAESQARADAVNATGADIMLVIHFNGSDDRSQSGTEVYYNPARSFGDKNRRLAFALHDALIAALRALPYAVNGRGVKDDAPIGERFGQAHTFLLGEAPGFRPTMMPAALVEGLFVTNDAEAALLLQDSVRETIAQAYIAGVRAYFGN